MSLPPLDHRNVFLAGLGESRLIYKASGSSRSRAAARGAARQAASSSKSSGGSSSSASKAAAASSASRAAASAAASRAQQVATQRKAQQAAAAAAASRAQQRAAATAAANKAAATARLDARRTARITKANPPKPTTVKPTVPTQDPARLRALGVDDAISERTLQMLNEADPEMAKRIERLLPMVGNFDLLSEDERSSFFNQITAIANDNVDEPWDNKLQRARSVMNNTIGAAKVAFDRLQDNEKEKLKQAVTGLDDEVSSNLQVGIDQLNRRGALSGGLFQRLANELLTAREAEATRLQNISDLNVKSAQTQKELAEKEANFALEDFTGEVSDSRKASRDVEFNDLLNNLVSLDVLKQKASLESLDEAEAGGVSSASSLKTKQATAPAKRTVEQIRTAPVDTSGLSRARPVTAKVTPVKLTSKNSTAKQRMDSRLSARQARLSASSLR